MNWIDTSGTAGQRRDRIALLQARADRLQGELDRVCDEIEALERSLCSAITAVMKEFHKA